MTIIKDAIYQINSLQSNLQDMENSIREIEKEDIGILNDNIQSKINKIISEWDYLITHNFEA